MNKKLLSFLLLVLALAAGINSCKKADPEPKPLSAENEFFPLQKGKYVIYDVDSTIWDDAKCVIVKRHYQFMYLVADTFTNEEGNLSYRIDTRKRKKPEDTWETHDVYYATNTGTTLEMTYDELKFIKLQFPVKAGSTWEGNALINTEDKDLAYFKGWQYSYEKVNDPFSTGNVMFENTITVLQRDETIADPETIPDQFSMRNYSREVFASGVGMVYREYYHWTYDPTIMQNNDPNNDARCRKGTGVIMRAVDHN
jgi:hypothetical protein